MKPNHHIISLKNSKFIFVIMKVNYKFHLRKANKMMCYKLIQN